MWIIGSIYGSLFKVHLNEYKVLPFGLATVPSVFTKCMAEVVAHLRSMFPYFDYCLFTASSALELQRHLSLALQICQPSGLQINWEKLNLVPQQTSFIGARLDSVVARVFLPEDKALCFKCMLKQLMFNCFQKVITIQRLLGVMALPIFMIPFAHLKMQPLQNWFIRVFNPTYTLRTTVFLSQGES